MIDKLSFMEYLSTVESTPKLPPKVKTKVNEQVKTEVIEHSKEKSEINSPIFNPREWSKRAAQICEGLGDLKPPKNKINVGGTIQQKSNISSCASRAKDLV